MEINWEQFEEQGSLDQAAVVIKTTGKVFPNPQAYSRLTTPYLTAPVTANLDGKVTSAERVTPNAVLIFYDEKQKILGFKPTSVNPESKTAATPFEHHGPSKKPFIPLANFFEAKNIPVDRDLHLQLEFDSSSDIYFVRLPKPGRNTRRPRRKK